MAEPAAVQRVFGLFLPWFVGTSGKRHSGQEHGYNSCARGTHFLPA